MNRLILFVLLSMLSNTVKAAPVLYLQFHMGLGIGGTFFVGGTLENKSEEDVHQGYVVVTSLSQDCYPKQSSLWPFGKIAANSKFEFKVPIEGKLDGYKLDLVYAMDSFGNKINVIDETELVLNSRQADYIAKCKQKRVENQGKIMNVYSPIHASD